MWKKERGVQVGDKKRVRWIGYLLILCLLLLGGCATNPQEARTEIVVFAAASLSEPLTEIGHTYEAQHPGVRITFQFDSSGTLKKQIEEGAACDLFISAAPRQMDALEEEGLLFNESRVDLLENQVCLAAMTDTAGNVHSFAELAQQLPTGELLLSIGNKDVPAGQYAQDILAHYGLSDVALAQAGSITYGSNVKEVVTQIREGLVDCGIIYSTDAYSAGLEILEVATAEECGPVVYPACVLKNTREQEQTEEFLTYLQGKDAIAVFEGVGFHGFISSVELDSGRND